MPGGTTMAYDPADEVTRLTHPSLGRVAPRRKQGLGSLF